MSGISVFDGLFEDPRIQKLKLKLKKAKSDEHAVGFFISTAWFYLAKANGTEVNLEGPTNSELDILVKCGLAFIGPNGDVSFPDDLVYYYSDNED